METTLKNQLEKTWNLTGPESEPEPYILTPDEENKVIENAINRQKEYVTWKMQGLGYTHPQIQAKIKEIDWELEIDRQEILRQANAFKAQDLWHQQQRVSDLENSKKTLAELKAKCDAKYMLQLMKWTSRHELGKHFVIHQENKHLITTLCFFFSGDPRFKTELNHNPNKGLLIRGISGLGKTHLVKCLANNELNPVLLLSMIAISETVKDEGEFIINLGDNKVIYLDDVGTEEHTINHYGTKINWFKNFAEMYYLKNKVFNKLVVSTNNSFDELEGKYGFRVRSRIKDMFNIIDVKGKDMRGDPEPRK